ncbi:DUF3253 domain-containing protein [Jannaschia seohaensis]|uniref:Uncharacterized protein DUF3253 n=1 Tax=Jannaschia seohaensis TaxID=475081 RepID=A0A2Y9A2L7_9RHOB|nr:DUF3253 domain-containing protein [Jannaschia seohaensis]PWJ22422.1 uncharacterized protein DUF3253 [Jannaschia seohaensis]SSA38700.1 Protein of unknown function [Jannaschia seohaensis]
MARVSDAEIARVIRTQATERAPRTLCPSEVARALAVDWRPLMPRVRAVAATLPEIVATQKGDPVDPVAAKGPIRLARTAGP